MTVDARQPHAGLPARLLRIARSRPRLWSAVAIGVLVFVLLPAAGDWRATSRALVAWNAFAVLYLAMALHETWGASSAQMQRRAQRLNEGRVLVLALTVAAAVAVLVAVGSQLAVVKTLAPLARATHIAVAALTVATSWLFTQTLFTLHYAHDFYALRSRGLADPLLFPGTSEPLYSDFFYFACVIGTSGQTADVAFVGSSLRPVGTLHCVLAFAFNTTVLALTINIAAGLF